MPKSHAHAREFRQVLRLCALLGHPLRVVILQRLARQPATAGVLASQLPVSRVAVVQHLKRLERSGLLVGVRLGRSRLYQVRPGCLQPLARWLERLAQAARSQTGLPGR
jgi:DNA-binding transcriptional ArsR family regulator